ncbi:MAG: FKBP-type peptidyl-prolyl cis-trans isomerase [Candidatus Thermoplasmatota archaeon]|nr:FKBP-type peptidyl-prolyl cis-trans isomerase [Candidatus Thermoplasmatota archaeon]
MKLEKPVLLAIVALVTVAAAASGYYGYELWKEGQPLEVKTGDFVEMYYIGYLENETVFASSFSDQTDVTVDTPFHENATNATLTLFKAYVGEGLPSRYPPGWTSSSLGRIVGARLGDLPGLRKGLLGMREGQEKTIGPLSPENAYGLPVEEGITFTTDFAGVDQEFMILNVTDGNLTLTWMPVIGEKFTLPMFWGEEPIPNPYWVWSNATEVTNMTETEATILTTPNRLSDLTLYPFWENTTEATYNETTISLTTTPEVGLNFTYYGAVYTVENVTADIINISIQYGNQTYYQDVNRTMSFPRTMTITRIFEDIPQQQLQQDLQAAGYSTGEMAGKTVYFRVHLVNIHRL